MATGPGWSGNLERQTSSRSPDSQARDVSWHTAAAPTRSKRSFRPAQPLSIGTKIDMGESGSEAKKSSP
jgi:hypothetical protein